MTDGTGNVSRSERSSPSAAWMTSAFSLSTSTTARRIDTTQSGSKLAFSTSALLIGRSTLPHGLGVPPAPSEVRDHVGGLGLVLRVAVGRLQTKAQIRGIGGRQRRPAPPPPR